MSGLLVYVAGPYSQGDQVLNVRAAVTVADALLAAGHVPIVPHLTMLWHAISPHDTEEWYRLGEQQAARADMTIRLPGLSTGADRECAAARAAGQWTMSLTLEGTTWELAGVCPVCGEDVRSDWPPTRDLTVDNAYGRHPHQPETDAVTAPLRDVAVVLRRVAALHAPVDPDRPSDGCVFCSPADGRWPCVTRMEADDALALLVGDVA